jgi:hypothetical protein
MIDPAMLRQLGWSEELIAEVERIATQIRGSAVESGFGRGADSRIAVASTIVLTNAASGASVALYEDNRR